MIFRTMSPSARARRGTALTTSLFATFGALMSAVVASPGAHAQEPDAQIDRSVEAARHGRVHVPETSYLRSEDHGVRAHTNYQIYVPETGAGGASVQSAAAAQPDYVGAAPTGETPASIRAAYGVPAGRGAGVIAIVDAYDYPTALNDFNVFSRQFGLPTETSTNATASSNARFQVLYAKGSRPAANAGWSQEAALDIEWAHAMAPGAKIVLVEAASSSFSDLFAAVAKANSIPTIRQISMSWGGGEFSSEPYYDRYFTQPTVVYFASSGDTGGVMEYPAASPNVVSAGGTTIHRSSTGTFLGETGWSGAGGGVSQYESRPSYQNGIYGIVGFSRGVPDYSFDADPNSGVSVYCSTANGGYSGWLVFGGTSVAAPSLAGIVNTAATVRGSWANSSAAELGLIYSNLGNASVFNDVVGGTAGSFTAVQGWDFVTGVGSTHGISGK